MSKTRRVPNRDLPAFGVWLRNWLDAEARREGVSIRKLTEMRGSNRANLNRWQNLTNDMAGPTRETVDREFDQLNISDEERVEPYGYLGWKVVSEGERLTSLEAKMARAEALLRLDLSPTQRAEYERMLEDFEVAHEAMLDRFFKRVESDMASRREAPSDEAERGNPNG